MACWAAAGTAVSSRVRSSIDGERRNPTVVRIDLEQEDFLVATFTPEGLVEAIRGLFELNHYSVQGSTEIHGAEVDLIARPLNDPFGSVVYIEATVENVTVTKYGKDLTKLAMIGNKEPSSQRLIVSSTGFTNGVRERASQTGIQTFTYDELFRRFERFEPYMTEVLGDSPVGRDLKYLDAIYEEPTFKDQHGEERATSYLTAWRADPKRRDKWLVITGEYGTGKTALTKVLLKRWLEIHARNPAEPVPFRIELRDFSRQFDARGLLHHFLDRHKLGHVSVDFVYSLVRSGRVILLLDGYDEMAQYLHARERRACLEALAELSADGARGMLTSRPNYFTETEEFQVFDVLYSSLKNSAYNLTREATQLLDEERRVDQLLENFLDRHERRLRDLSPAQTDALLGRLLANDPPGRAVVQGILGRVFRSIEGGDALSLSGKPVIISYLVEVVEQLKRDSDPVSAGARLTEWQVYKLIVDQLMLRDFARAPDLNPELRRRFLQRLALLLSRKDYPIATEGDVKDLIAREFKRDLDRLPGESRSHQLERYFADLRASATLTRAAQAGTDGWRFSHNSLREYLVAEALVRDLFADGSETLRLDMVPVSDAMRAFATSRTEDERRVSGTRLTQHWGDAQFERFRGAALSLLWDGLLPLHQASSDPVRSCLRSITNNSLNLEGVMLSRVQFSHETQPAQLDGMRLGGSVLSEVRFDGASLKGASFAQATLENLSFIGADLTEADFSGAFLSDCNFSGATVIGSDFRGVQPTDIAIIVEPARGEKSLQRLQGADALGMLQFLGAATPPISPIHRIKHHRRFGIVDKILQLLTKQTRRQRRGLEQRGEAQTDVPFARKFVAHLEAEGYVRTSTKDTVDTTEKGRDAFGRYVQTGEVPDDIVRFLGLEMSKD